MLTTNPFLWQAIGIGGRPYLRSLWTFPSARSPLQLATDLATGLELVYSRNNTRVRLLGSDMAATAFFMMNAFLEPRYQHMVASSYWYAPAAYLTHVTPKPAVAMVLLKKIWKAS